MNQNGISNNLQIDEYDVNLHYMATYFTCEYMRANVLSEYEQVWTGCLGYDAYYIAFQHNNERGREEGRGQ